MAYTFEAWEVWTVAGAALSALIIILILFWFSKTQPKAEPLPKPEKKVPGKVIKEEKIVSKTPIKDFNVLKTRRSKLNILFWKDHFTEKWFPGRVLLINMELINGFHASFLVMESQGSFTYKGGRYVIDDDSKYYNISVKLWCLDYHETIGIPIKRINPVDTVHKIIAASNTSEQIQHAINPASLDRYVKGKVIESMMKGAALDEFMRRQYIMMILNLTVSVITLLLLAHTTGLFKNLSIPGIS